MSTTRSKHQQSRGFTLVELMIVVAIIGVLAALAVYGVKNYLNHSKTAEVRQTIGAIARAAAAAFEGERTGAELVAPGSSASNMGGGVLCDDAPLWVPHSGTTYGKKYQPKTTDGNDFNTTSATAGWKCLKFSMSQPISFAYRYEKDNNSGGTAWGTACAGKNNFYAMARGDLDGDNNYSYYSRCGKVDNSQLKLTTQLHIVNDGE